MTASFSMRAPDDLHVHLRQPPMLADVLPETARCFRRALVMPNIRPAARDAARVRLYKSSILDAMGKLSVPPGFDPVMTLNLDDRTTPDEVAAARLDIAAVKLYPKGMTTNSDSGVTWEAWKIGKWPRPQLQDVFRLMEEQEVILCIHGESPGRFCMDRELHFLDDVKALADRFPQLRIVLEHITTKAAVEAVEAMPKTVAATITAHHLVYTLDDVVGGSLNPHAFCKPIAKTGLDRKWLLEAATRAHPKFFFGSDSAPHLRGDKECSSGCAGVFSAPCALEVLASVFEGAGRLDKLEAFTSVNGAMFYGWPMNQDTVELSKRPMLVPEEVSGVVPFMAGKEVPWSVTGASWR